MVANRKKKTMKKKQVRRFWRRENFKDHEKHREYYHLYRELRKTDREFHYRYLRMSKERFDHLLELVRDKITKKDTYYTRKAIISEERLVITLRYLASGMSQQDCTTASNILIFSRCRSWHGLCCLAAARRCRAWHGLSALVVHARHGLATYLPLTPISKRKKYRYRVPK